MSAATMCIPHKSGCVRPRDTVNVWHYHTAFPQDMSDPHFFAHLKSMRSKNLSELDHVNCCVERSMEILMSLITACVERLDKVQVLSEKSMIEVRSLKFRLKMHKYDLGQLYKILGQLNSLTYYPIIYKVKQEVERAFEETIDRCVRVSYDQKYRGSYGHRRDPYTDKTREWPKLSLSIPQFGFDETKYDGPVGLQSHGPAGKPRRLPVLAVSIPPPLYTTPPVPVTPDSEKPEKPEKSDGPGVAIQSEECVINSPSLYTTPPVTLSPAAEKSDNPSLVMRCDESDDYSTEVQCE